MSAANVAQPWVTAPRIRRSSSTASTIAAGGRDRNRGECRFEFRTTIRMSAPRYSAPFGAGITSAWFPHQPVGLDGAGSSYVDAGYGESSFTGYALTASSTVTMKRSCCNDCATKMRSNGSRCSGGSVARCANAGSSMARLAIECACRCLGMNSCGGAGKGSFPRACLITASQTEATLRKTSFAGFCRETRYVSGKPGSALIYQRKMWVSSKSFIGPRTPRG